MIRKRASEFHYQFMQAGKMYYGVCEGCTTERAALAYEKKVRDTVKKAAEQTSVKAIVENFKRELTGGNDIMLSDAFELYLAKPARRHPGKERLEVNRRRWRDFAAFMAETFPDISRLDQVIQKHAEAYINHLRTNGRFIKTVEFAVKSRKATKTASYTPEARLSVLTINEYHQTCWSVFERLKTDAGVVANPFDFAKMQSNPEGRDAFTPEELRLIGDNLAGFVRPLFIIGICTGLTLGDICLLEWRDIRGGWTVRKRNKTGAALEIPMLPPVIALIEEQRRLTGEGEFVLPEHAAMYQTNRSGVSYRVKQYLEGLGIETTRNSGSSKAASVKDFHSLRHSFAYIAGLYQMPLSVVQSILGHMTPEMTKHYQAHATREDKEKYMKQLPNFLGSSNPRFMALPEKINSPEREELRRLADTLPLDKIVEILKYSKQIAEA